MDKFLQLDTTRKGDIGERIVDQYFLDQQWEVYAPISSGAHTIDRIYMDRIVDGGLILKTIWADIKTKPSRNLYADTGINSEHYWRYMAVEEKHHKPTVCLFFVDEVKKQVYGNFLAVLDKKREVNGITYPLVSGCIRYFPLAAMKHLLYLTDLEVAEIKELSTRNYEYLG